MSTTNEGGLSDLAGEARVLSILYGSETGNSEDIAIEIGKMADRLHFKTTVDEMDNFKLSDLIRAPLCIFVTSTVGQGDMPNGTCKFWRNLRREKLSNTNCLGSVKFALLGLGDSSYPKFNWAARKLHARLSQLGATEFFRTGEADERHDDGIDTVYVPWMQDLKTLLQEQYPTSKPPIPEDVQLPPKYPLRLETQMDDASKSAVLSHVDNVPRSYGEQLDVDRARGIDRSEVGFVARAHSVWERTTGRPVQSLDKDNIITDDPEKYGLEKASQSEQKLPPDNLLPLPGAFIASVVKNERVTPQDHWQDVRHVVLNLPHKWNGARGLKLPEVFSGSTLIVYPKNFPADVQSLIDLMGWNDVADRHVDLTYLPRKIYATQGATLRDLLTHNLDITAIPKRSFIEDLIWFTKDSMEKERLRELSKAGDLQEYYDYASRPRRTILEVLRDFKGVQIPWDWAVDMFPVIRGREFSIANGGLNFAGQAEDEDLKIELLVALVEYKTIIRKPRQGLCSRYLKHLPAGTNIVVGIKITRSDALRPDENRYGNPVIAIATGTGVAPVRSFIQQRLMFERAGEPMGKFLLFYGCRNQNADFFFHDEWDKTENLTVRAAFSRDPVPEPDKPFLNPYDPWPDQRLPIHPKPAGSTGKGLEKMNSTNTDLVVFDYDKGKNYVQHKIRKYAQEIGDMIRAAQGGDRKRLPITIVICGNAGRMPKSVRSAILDALIISDIARDREQAESWFNDRANVDFWQETW